MVAVIAEILPWFEYGKFANYTVSFYCDNLACRLCDNPFTTANSYRFHAFDVVAARCVGAGRLVTPDRKNVVAERFVARGVGCCDGGGRSGVDAAGVPRAG